MMIHDIVGNLHLHTTASDGTGSHDEVAAAAAQAGLDFIVYTDHNRSVHGVNGWYRPDGQSRAVLRLMGQEVNDEALEPAGNHLLCHFVTENFNGVAADPQRLIDAVAERGGLTFLAHPLERPGYGAAAVMYPWRRWDVSGFTGLEIWNAMTDVKWQLRTIPRGLLGAYLREWVLSQPFPELLAKWDELLATGQKVVAIGNSDAHAMSFSLGPLTRTMYPYEFLFRAVNTHLLLVQPLDHEPAAAQQQIYQALQAGHCYVSNDLIASPKGFLFTGRSGSDTALMGDTLPLRDEALLTVSSPRRAKIRLLKDGQLLTEVTGRELTWKTNASGVYRVEVYRWFWGWSRGWIYSNPIYVR